MSDRITLHIDGRPVEVRAGTTVTPHPSEASWRRMFCLIPES